jgi:hypothetical protein
MERHALRSSRDLSGSLATAKTSSIILYWKDPNLRLSQVNLQTLLHLAPCSSLNLRAAQVNKQQQAGYSLPESLASDSSRQTRH